MRVERSISVKAQNINRLNKCKRLEENPLPWTDSSNYLVTYCLQIQPLLKHVYLKRWKELERRSFQAYTAGVVHMITFYAVTVCGIISFIRRIGETCCLHLQGKGICFRWTLQRLLRESVRIFQNPCNLPTQSEHSFFPNTSTFTCTEFHHTEGEGSTFLRNV
jgi:hypothetical protein